MAEVAIPNLILSNNVAIPALGLGTYPMSNNEVVLALHSAKQIGYTLFDTSNAYGNEWGVGRCLDRDDFVTTKISNAAQRQRKVWGSFQKGRVKLRRRKIDLLLLHWPYPDRFTESWKILENLYREGACRAIGVANFKIHHLQELMESAEIAPMVNQFERHPMYAEADLTEWCKVHGIVPEAYTPFARMDERLFADARLLKISKTHGKKPTQIILRWNYQHGVVSIPKTSSPERMLENASIFDFNLSEEEMALIDSMECGMRVRFDPDSCDFDRL